MCKQWKPCPFPPPSLRPGNEPNARLTMCTLRFSKESHEHFYNTVHPTFNTFNLSLSFLGGLDELTKGTSSESPECPTMSSCASEKKHDYILYYWNDALHHYLCNHIRMWYVPYHMMWGSAMLRYDVSTSIYILNSTLVMRIKK